MYDLNHINSYLKTKVIGQTIIQYDNLNSTHSKARSIFSTCPDGTVVLAEDQSKCQIRFGKEWVCLPDKNIYLSIILKSVNNNDLLPLIDVIGCSSIHKSIGDLYDLDSKIKWPNDILINSRKISSVSSASAGKGSGIILSININVNMDEEIEGLKSTSIKMEKGEYTERELLIGDILNNIERHYEELIESGSASNSVDIYNKNLLFTDKEIGIVRRGRKTIRKVVVKGIDRGGCLVVIDEKGNEEILSSGETIIQYEET